MTGKRAGWVAVGGMMLIAALADAGAEELPAVPAELKSAGVLRVGSKCDYPPDGFIDEKGANAGVEIDLVRQLAAWALGDPAKLEITCVTAANRIPYLISRKVDLVVATMGVTEERAKVIDFTEPYRWGAGDIMLPKDSPVKTLDELASRTTVMVKGTIEAAWFDGHLPGAKTLRLDGVSDALEALRQGRAEAFAHDEALLIGLVAKNPGYRLLRELYTPVDTAAGVRKGDAAMRDYVGAAIRRMRDEQLFRAWVDKWVEPGSREVAAREFLEPKPTGR